MEKIEGLTDLKKNYKKFEKKYNLPKFAQLSEDFDIEKVAEKEETEFLLREIRKAINEKISAYFHLFEMMINPISSQIFIFSLLKNLNEKDTKMVREIYQQLAKLQIKAMQTDIIYKEENEADFISHAFKIWQDLKPKINDIFEKFDKKYNKDDDRNRRGYFR